MTQPQNINADQFRQLFFMAIQAHNQTLDLITRARHLGVEHEYMLPFRDEERKALDHVAELLQLDLDDFLDVL